MFEVEQVRVYFNLHKKLFSIQRKEKGKGWRVDRHVQNVLLGSPRFVVYESGRQRTLSERSRNVHAYVEGRVLAVWNQKVGDGFMRRLSNEMDYVSYNPYRHDRFHSKHGDVGSADTAFLVTHDNVPAVWVENPQ